jgi:hypothetical protein
MSTCTIKTSKKLDATKKAILENFIGFCKEKLEINKMPGKITIFHKKSEGMTTGGYMPESREVTVLGGQRLFIDILRSVAHELTHHKQNERGNLSELLDEYPEDLYAPYENEAYEKSGNLVKEWVRTAKKTNKYKVDLYELYY